MYLKYQRTLSNRDVCKQYIVHTHLNAILRERKVWIIYDTPLEVHYLYLELSISYFARKVKRLGHNLKITTARKTNAKTTP